MVPSRTLVNIVAKAFGVDAHEWDLALLASVHQDTLRQELVDELLFRKTPWLDVQRALRYAARSPHLSAAQHLHARWLLANQLAHRGSWLRVVLFRKL